MEEQLYALQLASKKRASSWLNALLLKRYGFSLTKTTFRDGLAIGHGWGPKNIPASCTCGENFNLAHALHCAKGGYTHVRHSEIRDSFADVMKDVCFDVELEPKLHPLDSITEQLPLKTRPGWISKQTIYGKRDSIVRFSM